VRGASIDAYLRSEMSRTELARLVVEQGLLDGGRTYVTLPESYGEEVSQLERFDQGGIYGSVVEAPRSIGMDVVASWLGRGGIAILELSMPLSFVRSRWPDHHPETWWYRAVVIDDRVYFVVAPGDPPLHLRRSWSDAEFGPGRIVAFLARRDGPHPAGITEMPTTWLGEMSRRTEAVIVGAFDGDAKFIHSRTDDSFLEQELSTGGDFFEVERLEGSVERNDPIRHTPDGPVFPPAGFWEERLSRARIRRAWREQHLATQRSGYDEAEGPG
jgi:hypothetical protein